jgi:hypothetical protein
MKHLRALFWKSNSEQSLEHFSLSKTLEHFILEGVVFCNYGEPTRVAYTVIASSEWQTRSVEVSMVGKERKNLRLRSHRIENGF